MSHYLLSVVTPTDGTPPAAEELDTIMKNVDTLHREMRDAGAWVFSGGLDAADTATVVRPRGDELLLTDGPFIEAKEYVGGISIIDVPDLDAALDWGRRLGAGDRAADRGPAVPLGMTVDESDVGARLPRGVRPRRRRPGPCLRRHRPRRGGGPGGLRRGGAALARERAAARARPAGSSPPPATGRSTGCAGRPPGTTGRPRRPAARAVTSRWRRAPCATTGCA